MSSAAGVAETPCVCPCGAIDLHLPTIQLELAMTSCSVETRSLDWRRIHERPATASWFAVRRGHGRQERRPSRQARLVEPGL